MLVSVQLLMELEGGGEKAKVLLPLELEAVRETGAEGWDRGWVGFSADRSRRIRDGFDCRLLDLLVGAVEEPSPITVSTFVLRYDLAWGGCLFVLVLCCSGSLCGF